MRTFSNHGTYTSSFSVSEKHAGPSNEAILPPPAVHFSTPNAGRLKRTRIKDTARGLRMCLDRVLRRFSSGTAPSASSVDLEVDSVEDEGAMLEHFNGRRRKLEEADEIDEVVVDREWGEDLGSATHSDHGEQSRASHPGVTVTSGTETASVDGLPDDAPHASSNAFVVYLRWRIWPSIKSFFYTRFMDEKSEEQYRKESWFLRKNLALWSAAFFILNWLLSVCFMPKPVGLSDKIFHYGFAPAFTFPIFFMVLFDLPRDRPWIYQVLLTISTWMWCIFQVILMYLCAFYGHHTALISCGSKDFMSLFYFANAPQTIALFGLGLQRFPAFIGSLSFMTLCFALIVPDRTTWVRNVINFLCFQAFLLYVHYMRENAERRMYNLRDQLKVQFRATQKAQVNERKAADSKRRLTSYVFHEVRVPLNTALLAVQNMAASGTVAKSMGIEFKALEGSLSMMSKVLNDVLDFNRMDSGRFESVAKPYSFHQVMRSMFVPLRLATDARGLSFVTDLDKNIDRVARRALYEAMGYTEADVVRKLTENPEEDGIVVGDETRLNQIITNLASNACKFTPAGGQLSITTRLVLPHSAATARQNSDTGLSKEKKDYVDSSPESESRDLSDDVKATTQLSVQHLERHNSLHYKPPPLEQIAVRIEISDTGCGIRPQDMVQCRLFSAFNQTERGRQQGGKGTGLGLALVRQIVKLSGGRLGVKSRINCGSTFWVELPLGIGHRATSSLTTPISSPPPRLNVRPTSKEASKKDNVFGSTTLSTAHQPSATSRGTLPRTISAMHSIMDQGGLVEISTDGNPEGKILTRQLGDLSTGTDPTPTVPLTTPDDSPAVTPPARPPQTSTQASEATVRPTHVDLPARPSFSTDEEIGDSLPDSPIPTPSESAHSSAMAWEPGLRVLVVDDDPLTRKLMARLLTRLGCKVSTAENGDIALELILGTYMRPTPSSEDTGSAGLSIEAMSASCGSNDEYKYHIIFLDNQMPVLSGLDAVARLREMGRDDFVVGVTGNALLADQQEFMDAGVNHVLTKPVLEKSLKGMLKLADQRRRQGLQTVEPPDTPSDSPPPDSPPSDPPPC